MSNTKTVFLLPIIVLIKQGKIKHNEMIPKTFSMHLPYRSVGMDFTITERMVEQFGKIYEVPDEKSVCYRIDDYHYLAEWFIDAPKASKILYKD